LLRAQLHATGCTTPPAQMRQTPNHSSSTHTHTPACAFCSIPHDQPITILQPLAPSACLRPQYGTAETRYSTLQAPAKQKITFLVDDRGHLKPGVQKISNSFRTKLGTADSAPTRWPKVGRAGVQEIPQCMLRWLCWHNAYKLHTQVQTPPMPC
jgi:hypothetical protein